MAKEIRMKKKITTFLTFKDRAEEAVKQYTSIFKNSRIISESRYGDAGPGAKGSLMAANFELDGEEFVALNGGPSFEFSQGFSLLVDCENQAEVDRYWEKLSDGGSKGPCGWLTDRFGVSWQVIPRVLTERLSDPDPARAARVMKAMLQMSKIDIAKLDQAYEGETIEATSGR
jgi:predicted 3-demethylubiquinone-9 3-methyltransferase (glyoxalase superfamily)